ncbi:hypothetical protein QTP88_008936 [Uroleucon formosanum]
MVYGIRQNAFQLIGGRCRYVIANTPDQRKRSAFLSRPVFHFRKRSRCMNTVKHKPGLQLQYLLQGGSYRNTKLHKAHSPNIRFWIRYLDNFDFCILNFNIAICSRVYSIETKCLPHLAHSLNIIILPRNKDLVAYTIYCSTKLQIQLKLPNILDI